MRDADAPACAAVTTAALFDTANFPIDQPDSADYERLVGSARTGLEEHNCVVIDVENPDCMASPEYARRLWGEVHPMQTQAAAAV